MVSRVWRILPVTLFGLAQCGDITPTTVVGTWDLVSVDGTEGQHIIVQKVFSMELRMDGSVSYVSCLMPVAEEGVRLVCRQKLACAKGTYQYNDATISLRQNGRMDAHGGTVTFAPEAMVINGAMFLAPWIARSNFQPISQLTNDCNAL